MTGPLDVIAFLIGQFPGSLVSMDAKARELSIKFWPVIPGLKYLLTA